MEEAGDGIPPDVRALIAGLDSVVQLETLLLLHRNPGRQWTAEQVAGELRIGPAAAVEQMDLLCARGLLICQGEAPIRSYREADHSSEIKKAIEGLEAAYAQRRVTVITLIFSKPVDPVRSFADAFKLRRNPPDA